MKKWVTFPLHKGYVLKDKIGYKFDVKADKVEIKAITNHIDVKQLPFW